MTEHWRNKPEPIPASNIVREWACDIVVIGSGHAGTLAARMAAECGASVIVLEQQSREKQFILGVGEIGHINSKWQEEHGVPKVDIDEFVQDWQTRTNNRSNYRLIRTYAEQCGEAFDYFIEPLSEEEKAQIHAMLTPQSVHFPKSINGFHSYTGTPHMGPALQNKAVRLNQKLAEEKGAEFFFETKAVELTLEKERVTGVIAKKGEEYLRFNAKKGVLLAAGDYSKNKEMCLELLTEMADLVDEGDFSGHGWDGSGIRMGMWAGGRLEPRSHAAMGGNYSFPGFDIIGSTAVLRVNEHGIRYSDEGFGTHILAAIPGARQPNGRLFGVFDSNILDQTTYQPTNHAVFDYADEREVEKLFRALAKAQANKGKATPLQDKAGETRVLYCADTVEELAEALFYDEVSRENFVNAVLRYNVLCEAGIDHDFGKDPHLLYPISKAPFYACTTVKDSHKPGGQSLKLLVTAGGLLINEKQQVLGQDFEPIPGLFATGNCSGCRFGAQYTTSVPGQSISIAQTLGREAGRLIVEEF